MAMKEGKVIRHHPDHTRKVISEGILEGVLLAKPKYCTLQGNVWMNLEKAQEHDYHFREQRIFTTPLLPQNEWVRLCL